MATVPKSGSGSAKGFPDNLYIPPGGSIRATLCQVPWAPEDLDYVGFAISGTDDNRNFIEVDTPPAVLEQVY